jgi:hypothetical protein
MSSGHWTQITLFAAGTPISGTVATVFSLYALETEGAALWMESHPDIEVTAGIL